MDNDRLLVEDTLRGNLAAFGELVGKYQYPLVASACHLLRQVQDAEDMAMETLFEAYQHLPQLHDLGKFRPWLFAILRRKCLRHLHRKHPEEVSLDVCAEIPAMLHQLTDSELIEAMNQLPLADREVLAARYLYELDYEDIAQLLGSNVRAMYMRCKRARERLHALLRQADEQETREVMRRAMGIMVAGLAGHSLVEKVLSKVQHMEMSMPAPRMMPNLPALHLSGSSAWLPVAGWKTVIGVTVALALAGGWLAQKLLAHHAALPAAAAALDLPVAVVPVAAALPVAEPPTAQPTPPAVQHIDTTAPPLPGSGAVVPAVNAPVSKPGPTATTPAVELPAIVVQSGRLNEAMNARVPAPHLYDRVTISPDGAHLAVWTTGEVVVLDLSTGLIEGHIMLGNYGSVFQPVTFSPDSRALVFGTIFDQQRVNYVTWDLAHWRQMTSVTSKQGQCVLLPDGQHLLAFSAARNIPSQPGYAYDLVLREVATGKEILHGPLAGSSISIGDDGRRIAVFNGDKVDNQSSMQSVTQGFIQELQSGKQVALEMKNLPGPILGNADNPSGKLSPDGERFAAILKIRDAWNVLIWETRSGKLLRLFPVAWNNGAPDFVLRFSADHRRLAYWGDQQGITVWDIESGKPVQQLLRDVRGITDCVLTPDGSKLVLLSPAGGDPLQIIDLQTGKLCRSLSFPFCQPPIAMMVSSQDGHVLAIQAGWHLLLWDTATGRVTHELELKQLPAQFTLSLSPDGRILLVTDLSGNLDLGHGIQIYDVLTGKLVKEIAGKYVKAICSPDSMSIATVTADGVIALCALDGQTPARTLVKPDGSVSELAFSPDGRKLAWLAAEQGGGNGRLELLDLASGMRTTQQGRFTSLAFSQNSRWVEAVVRAFDPTLPNRHRINVLCWDTDSGKALATLLPPPEHAELCYAAPVSDNAHVIGESSDSTLICWDLASGKIAQVLPQQYVPNHMPILVAGNMLISVELDDTVKLREIQPLLAGAELTERAQLYTDCNGAWLTITPQGYFTCSPDGLKAIAWRYQGKLYPDEKFAPQYLRQDLLLQKPAR